jgi:hypothetical protein
MDDRHQTGPRASWLPWAITAVALVLVAAVAYSVGAQQQAIAGATPVRRVWVPFFPGLWVFLLVWLIFGGLHRLWWWGGYPYRPWRYRHYYDDRHDEREAWEEWHRRAHGILEDRSGSQAGPSSRDDRGPTT